MIAVDKGFAQVGSGSPERQLWCAVLDKVLEDLRNHLPERPLALTPRWANDTFVRRRWFLEQARWYTKHRDTITARAFAFSRGNKWRTAVCDFAGINEECFVKAARYKRYRVASLPKELANAEEDKYEIL